MRQKVLPHVQAVLKSLTDCTDDQKEALLYHFECLLSALASCVGAKYINNIPDLYHNSYLEAIGKNIVKNTEDYLSLVAPLGYIESDKRTEIIKALQKEVEITTNNAKGDVMTFGDWHTVI